MTTPSIEKAAHALRANNQIPTGLGCLADVQALLQLWFSSHRLDVIERTAASVRDQAHLKFDLVVTCGEGTRTVVYSKPQNYRDLTEGGIGLDLGAIEVIHEARAVLHGLNQARAVSNAALTTALDRIPMMGWRVCFMETAAAVTAASK